MERRKPGGNSSRRQGSDNLQGASEPVTGAIGGNLGEGAQADFKFGELRERTLHKQLKALYRPADGLAEWPVAGAIADLWSPTVGVIEIQTRNLAKLRSKVAAYLEAGLSVTVVFPLAVHRTIVTWSADRTQELSRRKSPKADRIEASFREIGTLAAFLLHPKFRLAAALIKETEHRCDDGQGSWRRQGRSKVDRVLESREGEQVFSCRQDYSELIPASWVEPGTAAELAAALRLRTGETQALVSCLKKLGIVEVCGKRGRAHLLRRGGNPPRELWGRF